MKFKVKILSEGHSIFVQECLFELGAEWASGHKNVSYTHAKWIFVLNGKMRYAATPANFEDYPRKSLPDLKLMEIRNQKIN